MSQRTLLLILGVAVTATLAWANLKADAAKNHDAILDLVAMRASDLVDRKADHDLLVSATGAINELRRQAERQERRDLRGAAADARDTRTSRTN